VLVLLDRPYPIDCSSLVQEKEEYETELEPNPIFFGLDFLIGIFHFMLIFAWARTITDLSRPHRLETGHFVIVGAFVLLYDWIWFAVCFRNVTGPKIRFWALLNTATVLISAAFFLVCLAGGQDAVFREQASLIPVIVISIIDIADLINSKSRIREFLMGLLRSAGPAPKNRFP
jgi:hypothetical protein